MTYKIDKIGTDPEFFVSSEGKIITSQEAGVDGTKEEPFNIGDNILVQRDNVALELSLDPAKNSNEFAESIFAAMKRVEEKYGINLVCTPSHVFEEKDIMFPEAYEFGCDPDFCAYTDDVNECPYTTDGLRSAGGHVHVGYTPEPDSEFNVTLAKAMDLNLALPMILFDKDKMRRKLYGKAGAFRHKPYGMEYRTLSNKWLESKEAMKWVFDNTHRAFTLAAEIHGTSKADEIDFSFIADAINNSNEEIAKELIEEYNVPVLQVA